jgi:RNA-directed DNA polymerase
MEVSDMKWNARYHDHYKHHSLIYKVWSMGNLVRAWKHVRANRGAGGVDKISVNEFEKDVDRHLRTIQRQLKEDRYNPMPVERAYILKRDGRQRPLGMPTIKDKIVQQALRQIIEPIFEEIFMDESYGYRPGRSTINAINRVRTYTWDEGYRAIADLDIKGFFDNVNHEILLDLVNEKISDGSILKLLRKFLESGVMEDGKYMDVSMGTPQGGVISPLLSNIYLHHLDRRLHDRGITFVRYADDIVILEEKTRDVRRALNLARKILEEDLSLELNEEKTSVFRLTTKRGLEYLGYHIFLKKVQPTYLSQQCFKDKVRFLTRRKQGKSAVAVIKKLNPVIRGWGNYYRDTTIKKKFWDLDFWIQRRIRGYIKKRWWWTDIERIPTKQLLKMGLETLESILDIPRPLQWRDFAKSQRPDVSRMREIRMYGSEGGRRA